MAGTIISVFGQCFVEGRDLSERRLFSLPQQLSKADSIGNGEEKVLIRSILADTLNPAV